jgi:thiosulfate dehydrogenase [quinone] large subunit
MASTFNIKVSPVVRWTLTIVRIVIGWHFLYEGISKIMTAGWSSAPYLLGSKWIFAPLFNAMANNPSLVAVIDFINIWE